MFIGISFSTIRSLIVIAILAFFLCFCIYQLYLKHKKEKEPNKLENGNNQQDNKGSILHKINDTKVILDLGNKIVDTELVTLFNRSKNPWGIKIPIFQAIRFGGCAIFATLGAFAVAFGFKTPSFAFFLISFLAFWYPKYYYRETAKERETAWYKFYEYIWVLKNNLMLYDAKKAYLNTYFYIKDNAPDETEIIQGFNDFYEKYNNKQIDPYLMKYYDFTIPKEIIQIVFNMEQTGVYPEEPLNNLRNFILNHQNFEIEKTLSSSIGKATLVSLPFLMLSVILTLLVPLLYQLLQTM